MAADARAEKLRQHRGMRAEQALERLGGVADTAALLELTNRRAIRIALRRGSIVRDNRGRYSLPGVDEAIRAANRLDGILTEDSAAQYYGWELKHSPKSPCIAVPRNRKLIADRRQGVRVRYVDIPADDVNWIATCPGATVMACAARMPFDEALAVADSALRHHDVTKAELARRAEAMPDRYRARCSRVARTATHKAANPFESVLHSIAEDVPGLNVEAQVWIDGIGRPDLVDRVLHLVLEARLVRVPRQAEGAEERLRALQRVRRRRLVGAAVRLRARHVRATVRPRGAHRCGGTAQPRSARTCTRRGAGASFRLTRRGVGGTCTSDTPRGSAAPGA
jgi:hypothetical protein